MRAFVVRPFGTQEGVDFDRVDRELIAPAFRALGLDGATTAEFVQAGNIRKDMFEMLLTSDLVVADISIHNANVFYELGIRHARRGRGTFLLRGGLPPAARQRDVPFDIRTDRYLQYDPANPAACLEPLVAGLRATAFGENADSPIYGLLAGAGEADLPREVSPPKAFSDDVERAREEGDAGLLSLLAEEARPFPWGRQAQRRAGEALLHLEAYDAARVVWEAVRRAEPSDYQANKSLGNIYHRLGQFAASNEVLRRVLEGSAAGATEKAEARGQLARNAKERWRKEWERLEDPAERRRVAVESPGLESALEDYAAAFEEDLNAFYPGINALGLLAIRNELMGTDASPADRQRQADLASAVRVSIQAALRRRPDVWARVSEADLLLLTSDDPGRVASAYRKALYNVDPFQASSAARQIQIYLALGVRGPVAEAAFRAVDAAMAQRGALSREPPGRILLFTGHRADDPGRTVPRFPSSLEGAARARIRAAVEQELQEATGTVHAIAGAASGGDLLFHEVCGELGISSHVYLALPKEQYVVESVQSAGPGWVQRFHALLARAPARVLCGDGALPSWLRVRQGYGIWQRSNRWMVHCAMASGADRVTLIALWNGEPSGDGPGGTADMIATAAERGAKQIIIRTQEL